MFEAINYLMFDKSKDELDSEIMSSFVPYMTVRFFSFYDPGYVVYANDTLNTYGNVLKTPEDQFRFFDNLIPKLRRKKIPYVKKPKDDTKVDETPVPEFYSKREINMLTNRGYLSKS
jgi:hypothetical protein